MTLIFSTASIRYNSRLRNVNAALEELNNLRTWWESLSMVEKRMPTNKEFLVLSTESHCDAEISAFIKGSTKAVTSSYGGGEENHEDGSNMPSHNKD